jgi:hypothetical protein
MKSASIYVHIPHTEHQQVYIPFSSLNKTFYSDSTVNI